MVPKRHNLILSVLLFCIGGFIFWEATTFPEQVSIFPIFIGSGIMALSLLLFLIQKPWASLRLPTDAQFKVLTYPAAIVFIVSFVSILLMDYLGFYICASIIIISFAVIFKGIKPPVAVTSLIVLNVLVYSLFYKYLGVPIPLGIFAS